MKIFIELLLVALAIVGLKGNVTPRNSHYVEHTDYCASRCEYYGKVCPILPIVNTGAGYDCNKGYCRLPSGNDCIAVDENAVYVENVDACGSLCRYVGGCPIRPGTPLPAGFNCKQGYCRRDNNSKCIREICYKKN